MRELCCSSWTVTFPSILPLPPWQTSPAQWGKGLSGKYPHSLFFPAPMEEAGPLKAGLLASHPEHRGDPNHQSHQILHEEQNQIWTAHLSDLQREKEGKAGLQQPPFTSQAEMIPLCPEPKQTRAGFLCSLAPGAWPRGCRAQGCLTQKAQLLWGPGLYLYFWPFVPALDNCEMFSSPHIGKNRSFDGINLYRTRCWGCSWEKCQWSFMDDPLFPQEFKVQVPGSYQPGQTFSLQGDQLNLRTLPRSFCTHRACLEKKTNIFCPGRSLG